MGRYGSVFEAPHVSIPAGDAALPDSRVFRHLQFVHELESSGSNGVDRPGEAFRDFGIREASRVVQEKVADNPLPVG
jgi:hypothetical protein